MGVGKWPETTSVSVNSRFVEGRLEWVARVEMLNATVPDEKSKKLGVKSFAPTKSWIISSALKTVVVMTPVIFGYGVYRLMLLMVAA